MKIIIAGSRTLSNLDDVITAIKASPFGQNITEVVSGGARGIDKCGEVLAQQWGLNCIKFLPQWDIHGKCAGLVRNVQMGNYADGLVAIWDGQSRGTKHMIDYMNHLRKLVYVHIRQSS